MADTVIAFVGENANGILECQSRRFLALMQPLGFKGRTVNLSDADVARQLDEAFGAGVAFAWGYAGIGARLSVQNRNLWDAVQVPFVSVLADAPYIMPTNHHVPTPWVVNGYVYREWLELQQQQIGSPQASALVPMGVVPNPARHDRCLADRSIRLLFVKSGGDPSAIRGRWASWPARLRNVLQECADALAVADPQPIAPTVRAYLLDNGLALDGSKPLLFGLMHELDTYLRAVRATAMARALLPFPADIVGDGWEHLSGEAGRARFHPAVDAGTLDTLYADTRILVNVTPNFASGAHERVLRGFAARCRVVSDTNEHGRTVLQGLPTYHGMDWHVPDLADRVAAAYYDDAPYDDRLDAAEGYVETNHSPERFLHCLAELAQLARVQAPLACYALDAA